MNEWQPIATAPRDGTSFDVWMPDDFGGYRVSDLHFNERGVIIRGGMTADLPRWPTHWMPLPAAPGAAA